MPPYMRWLKARPHVPSSTPALAAEQVEIYSDASEDEAMPDAEVHAANGKQPLPPTAGSNASNPAAAGAWKHALPLGAVGVPQDATTHEFQLATLEKARKLRNSVVGGMPSLASTSRLQSCMWMCLQISDELYENIIR